jgi:DNA-binding transcriptional LysR family regulator
VLKEVPLKETTMHRRLVVAYRENSYVPPAARLLITLLADASASA